MPRISYSIGFTVKIADYESARFDMSVSDIDPDQDITEQLRKSHEALWQTVAWAQEQAAVDLEKMYKVKLVHG